MSTNELFCLARSALKIENRLDIFRTPALQVTRFVGGKYPESCADLYFMDPLVAYPDIPFSIDTGLIFSLPETEHDIKMEFLLQIPTKYCTGDAIWSSGYSKFRLRINTPRDMYFLESEPSYATVLPRTASPSFTIRSGESFRLTLTACNYSTTPIVFNSALPLCSLRYYEVMVDGYSIAGACLDSGLATVVG